LLKTRKHKDETYVVLTYLKQNMLEKAQFR